MFVCPECGESHETGGFCTRDGTQLAAVGDDPLLGSQVGTYRIAQLVGVGGMGRVYKGVNPAIGSRVAIKVLSSGCADNPDLVERFFAEARAVNLIRHENIVNVLDLAQLPDRRPYIVMEYLDGRPLSSLIHERGPLPLGSLARIMGEVLSALGAAHAKGIVHRDLKPDNIFVTPHGRAKVLDFGIAKLQPEQSGRSAPTRDGSLMGTPNYMAPEQAQARSVTAQSDLYAAGVILFEGATGRPPFAADSLYDLLRMQVEAPPPPPRSLRPDLPLEYERLILRALAKDPQHRHESARALYHDLVASTRSLPELAWAPIGEAESQLTVGMGAIPTPAGPTPHGAAVGPRPTPQHQAQPSASPTPLAVGQIAVGPRRQGRAGLMVALGIGALAIAGIVVAAIVAGQPDEPGEPGEDAEVTTAATPAIDAGEISANSAPPPPKPIDDAPVAEAAADSAPTTRTAPPVDKLPTSARGSMANPSGADFDVTQFIGRATAIARRVFPDAVLVRIDAGGVRPSGRAELSLRPELDVTYRFVSPSRRERPADLPIGVEHEAECMYYVTANSREINFYPVSMTAFCKGPLIGPPKCSAKQVWSEAAARGAPTGNAVAEIGYWAGPGGKGRWHFGIDGAFSGWIPDNC
jgi:serine/threonine-protein kinase